MGLAAILGSILLFFLLQRALVASAQDVASARAIDIVRELTTESMPFVQGDLERNTRESQLIQVLGPDDAIVASSAERARTKVLATRRPKPGRTVSDQVHTLRFLERGTPFLLTASSVSVSGTDYTVVIATSLSAQSESLERLNGFLIAFVPLTMLFVAAGTWLLLGRALRPVERIRARAASIGADHLSERLPVPASGDEVARLAATMNEMLERVEAGQKSRRAFVADASHELRGPLSTLDASLEIVASDSSGQAWHDLHQVMAGEVARMERLVDDLLLLAKADDQGLRLRRADVDLDDIVAREARRLRTSSPVEVTVRIEPARVAGDEVRLGQLVRNLVDNAARAASARVDLSVRTTAAGAEIMVDDDGAGISEADRERIFDRFVRLDASRSRNSGGSGLGLAIAREIVRGHGGTVEVTVSPSGGARFIVRLPTTAGPESG